MSDQKKTFKVNLRIVEAQTEQVQPNVSIVVGQDPEAPELPFVAVMAGGFSADDTGAMAILALLEDTAEALKDALGNPSVSQLTGKADLDKMAGFASHFPRSASHVEERELTDTGPIKRPPFNPKPRG